MNSKPNKKKASDTNILTDDQKELRLKIVDMELRARYWESLWKVRFYTLEAEKLAPEYDQHMLQLREEQQKIHQQIQEELKKAKEMAGDALDVPTELLEPQEEVVNG